MKILYIDPSGNEGYAYGLTAALSKDNDVTVIARDNYVSEFESQYELFTWFKLSGKGKLKRIQKGISYLFTYFRILKLVAKENYDVVHINWFLMLRIDCIILKLLKKYCKNIVYTAHNIMPHIKGEKYTAQLTKIYGLVDKILVHGHSLKEELLRSFSTISEGKVYVQHFGADIRKFESNPNQCSKEIVDKLAKYKGLHLLFFGNILNEKAVERLLKFWNKYSSKYPDSILSVVGKVCETNELYEEELRKFRKIDNKLLIEITSYMSMEDHNYLYSDADILVLPYKRASMSAVINAAAAFKKTVICTDVGCFKEYIEEGVDGIIVSNDYKAVEYELLKVLDTMNIEILKKMGEKLYDNFYRKYDWEIIVKDELLPIYKENGMA